MGGYGHTTTSSKERLSASRTVNNTCAACCTKKHEHCQNMQCFRHGRQMTWNLFSLQPPPALPTKQGKHQRKSPLPTTPLAVCMLLTQHSPLNSQPRSCTCDQSNSLLIPSLQPEDRNTETAPRCHQDSGHTEPAQ